jgi:hypothetical protein
MYTAFVLVKNLDSKSDELNFSNFRLKKIQQDDDDLFDEARKSLFPGEHADKDDWIYERKYHAITPKCYNRILNDINDILFLLRLFKVGDLVFLQTHIKGTDQKPLCQLPYRVIIDISPFHMYEMQNNECSQFDEFASEIMFRKNWHSPWFQTARRFFLYGSSKEFNPKISEVDRIVDFMIVMESILVPERDFVGRRLRERAASLLKTHDIDYSGTKRLLRDFYELRSTIVHGSDVSSFKNVIKNKHIEFENIVRKVIIEAVKVLAEDDAHRQKYLKGLFDVSDNDRANKVYEDFCAIKNINERRRCSDLISNRLSKTENRKQKTENHLP